MIKADSGDVEVVEGGLVGAEKRLDFENCGHNGNYTGEKSMWKIWPNLKSMEGAAPG